MDSGLVSFDTFDIVVTGVSGGTYTIDIYGSVQWNDVDQTVPGFGADPANPDPDTETIEDLYCTSGSATAQNNLMNSTQFAILALYDEANGGEAKYILIGNDHNYDAANGSQATFTLGGKTYEIGNLYLD